MWGLTMCDLRLVQRRRDVGWQLWHNESQISNSVGHSDSLLDCVLRLRHISSLSAFAGTQKCLLKSGRVSTPEEVKSLTDHSDVIGDYFLGNFRVSKLGLLLLWRLHRLVTILARVLRAHFIISLCFECIDVPEAFCITIDTWNHKILDHS